MVRLAQGEVHVWRAKLLPPTAGQLSTLSADERERAETYRSGHDRSRFIAARSLLRQIIGGYLDRSPAELAFRYGPHGKPELTGEEPLRFNLSHAADMALFAVALDMELGVDLESASVLLEPESVVQRCMSQRERRRLHQVGSETRSEAILATWVRKEAVAKGRGEGMGLPLDKIETRPGMPASGNRVGVRIWPRDRWFVWDIPVGRGGAGALATRQKGVSVRLLDHPHTVVDLTGPAPLPSRDLSASLTP
ncbi:MAG: 4'-phosphopantetheinyl transferase family protein [Acidimicrobiia bacterium]